MSWCSSVFLVNSEIWTTWEGFSFTKKACKHRLRKHYWGHQAPVASPPLQLQVILQQWRWSKEPVSFMKITQISMPWRKLQSLVGKTKNYDTKEIRDVVRGREPFASIKLHRGIYPNSLWKWAIPHRTDKSQNSSIIVSIWPVENIFLTPDLACVSRIQQLSMQDDLIT